MADGKLAESSTTQRYISKEFINDSFFYIYKKIIIINERPLGTILQYKKKVVGVELLNLKYC